MNYSCRILGEIPGLIILLMLSCTMNKEKKIEIDSLVLVHHPYSVNRTLAYQAVINLLFSLTSEASLQVFNSETFVQSVWGCIKTH